MIFAICYLIILLLAFLLRLVPLSRYVTPDEPAWVYRSIRFADALAARDWAAVPATGHPGVTTTWLGALNVTLCRLLNPAESAAHLDWIRRMAWLGPENGEAFRHLAFFLQGGRIAVALVTTLGLAVLYPLLQRLFDRRLALLTIGLLALDPFLAGHSGLLHTDALLATSILLALAAALNGLREPHRAIWWMLSGLFTGLALLTKTPAVILVPFIGLVQLVAYLRHPPISNLQSLIWRLLFVICHFLVFILIAAGISFALYPALWANPAGTLDTLLAFSERHVETAQRPVFFAGQTTYDPGPLFYPAVLLFRISPVVVVGLAIGLIALRRLPAEQRLAFIALLVFSVAFGAMMSLGVKKHDRYLLPALPPLALAAGIGWGHLKHKSTPKPPYPLLPIQLLLALAFLLHPLTYANPLAGGPWIAARVIDLDWGGAMGEAARWLNRQPDAEQLTVATDAVPTFASIFKGRAVPLDRASLADYIALPNSHTPTPTYPIVHTVTLGLVDRAAIYTNTNPVEQAAFLTAHAEPGDLILLDADTSLLHRYAGPGAIVSLAGLPTQAAVAERLNELIGDHSRLWLVADPAASPFSAAYVAQSIESIATPVKSEFVGSSTITQFTVHSTSVSNLQSPVSNFGQITLLDASIPAAPINAPFKVLLRWQAPAPTPTDLHFSLYLVDADGHQWDDAGQLALNEFTFPTTQWDPGTWSDQSLKLSVPERTPPGIYTVKLTVTDDAGAQLGAWDAEGAFQGVRVVLGQVEIAPPDIPVGPAACRGRTIAAGPLTACAPEPGPIALSSGSSLTVPIFWSAASAPRIDYLVRWRLTIDGDTALEHTMPLSTYPTSNWRQDDAFDAYYALRIDPAVPAGTYALTFNVIDPDDNPLWAEDETIGPVEVLHRDRQFDLPDDIGHPLDLTLGDVIHLRGFDVSPLPLGEGTGVRARPGDALPLTLTWQADGPTDIDYTVFVHLVGPDGLPHGQLDVFPGGGSAPTSSWAPGQVVVDELALPIAADAAPGTYHVAVGLYDAASGGRLPITGASGQRLPGDRFILPIEITVGGSP
ncbi:MAG: glycosyltransferase family 39 protein [Anaerolineae bacterium]|nr:glycosyltransferase family 39 protein [Anaerolineae bacterium]